MDKISLVCETELLTIKLMEERIAVMMKTTHKHRSELELFEIAVEVSKGRPILVRHWEKRVKDFKEQQAKGIAKLFDFLESVSKKTEKPL